MRKITLFTLALFAGFGAQGQGCDELFFSEYMEGSSNNKYYEIYNASNAAVNLSDYAVHLFSNGGASASQTLNFPAGATLAAHDVYIVANASSDATI